MKVLRLFRLWVMFCFLTTGLRAEVVDLTEVEETSATDAIPVEEPSVSDDYAGDRPANTSSEEREYLIELGDQARRIERQEKSGFKNPIDIAAVGDIISFTDADDSIPPGLQTAEERVAMLRGKLSQVAVKATDVRTEEGRIHINIILAPNEKRNPEEDEGNAVRNFFKEYGSALGFDKHDKLVPLGSSQDNGNGTRSHLFTRYVVNGNHRIRVHDEVTIVNTDNETDNPTAITRARYLHSIVMPTSGIKSAEEIRENLKAILSEKKIMNPKSPESLLDQFLDRLGEPELTIGYSGFENSLVYVVKTPAGEFIQDPETGAVLRTLSSVPEIP